MIKIFAREDQKILQKNLHDSLLQNILWIDLQDPTNDEVSYIAQTYNLEIPSNEEREEIEESARYWEDPQSITINTYFLIPSVKDRRVNNQTITFILHQDILLTIRYGDFSVFDETQKTLLANPIDYNNGFEVISKIFEIRVEKDADMLENFARSTRALRAKVFDQDIHAYDEMLAHLSRLQEFNMEVRDSLFDKRRAITAMLKSIKPSGEIKKNLTIILKDINSLIEFANTSMNALDNIQSLLTNQINIEQNKTIKLFTVVTVVMMPPTLIGTIYGMNFKHMPELEWSFGYPLVILIMILSTLFPFLYFKKKGWLK
ncbi:magnesium and cobalt transport protein CorA [Helicobacter enhydrae]|uniref:Magnesium transport protein CorA n=1 Tax=Helicobacter enhydrae TaxID=222136 RepID=A0A1B1U7E6_9HELI|nr:magnesium/cobalt transporter CorA [Helicobacter enhydrae]ANV98698.1 magnesium and cobalt transport protein CorA [Helicobacter enhydrae]ANV98795.1 magnesium and cobalt transport protein CorA [Helicobacter enhydrae]